MKLPMDTVIDCIRIADASGFVSYQLVDVWTIGSRSYYKMPYLDRQEYGRVLVRGWNSRRSVLSFGGARPFLEQIEVPKLQAAKEKLAIFVFKTKKSEEKESRKPASVYWKPQNIFRWRSGRDKSRFPPFDEMLRALQEIDKWWARRLGPSKDKSSM